MMNKNCLSLYIMDTSAVIIKLTSKLKCIMKYQASNTYKLTINVKQNLLAVI